MSFLSFATVDALCLAALFAMSAIVHLSGAGLVRRAYVRWGFPGKFYRVSGVIHLLAALFLSYSTTRIWGVALAGIVTFAAAVLLLSHGRYRYSVPCMLLLVALVPAILAAPV
jgi:hypothetical protein